jgi:hypothetical protein
MIALSSSSLTRLSRQTWTYRINNQKGKENNLTVECIMDQRLLFVLTEDKQTIQGEGVNVLITQTKVLHIAWKWGRSVPSVLQSWKLDL